jgi:hypothetical protein
MSRGTTLGQLIEDLRAEAGHALAPSLGASTREVLISILRRQQKRLWEDYAWPFLRVRVDVPVQAGLRYYSIPSNLTYERIERMEFKWGDRWQQLGFGIGIEHLNQYDSDKDIRSYPVYRYQEAENNQIEVWPIPSQDGSAANSDGILRFTGIRNLNSLVADSDRADLDDQLIVLFAAGELLQRQKAGDAKDKLLQAAAHYQRLKARNSKSDSFVMSQDEPLAYTPKGPPMVAVQKP